MDEKLLEESNRSKYGAKDRDIISQAYEFSQWGGDLWCIFNIKRYIERFIRPNSSKANNLTDLLKARDYLNRCIQAHPDYKKELHEKIE